MTATKSAQRAIPTDLQSYADQHESDVQEAPMLATLRAEHRHIASVLALLSDHLNAIERSELVNTRVVFEIMDYLVSWPDRVHHPREDLIYNYASELDPELKADRQRLEHDHDESAKAGRALMQAIEDWRTGDLGGGEVIKLGRSYVQSSYAHMSHEEQYVFPAIDAALSRDDWRELSQDEYLKPIGDPVFGRRVQRQFRNMARKLRRSLRRGVERRAVGDWVSLDSAFEAYEVVSMAVQTGRSITRDQLVTGLRESVYITLEEPLKAPFLCAANNSRLAAQWLQEVGEVARDAGTDLVRVNRERQDRVRLLRR